MNTTKIPTWFKAVSILAIVWNALGALSYLGQAFTTEEMLQTTYNEAQIEAFLSKPVWATAAFAIAVWFGVAGSITLLMRKNITRLFLIVSFIGVLVHTYYMFFYIDATELFGPSVIYMPIFVLAISAYLIVLFNQAKSKGWIV